MRYPTSLENIVRLATLAATNCVASSAFELISRDADGGGTVALSGSYTGADDSVFDVEVTSNTIAGAPQISAPVFSGVGNGTIGSISADSGIAAQEFTVTVLDLGTPTRAAWAPFQAGNLRAKATGTAGNALSVRIAQGGLVATATDYAVTRELGTDGEEFTGEEYNFGALTIEPEGTVPVAAVRLRFGDDVTVYRHWREFRDSRYRYHFSPAIQRAIPVGTRVYAITGGRTATVYDGATLEETYPDVTTLYSLVSQIQADSTLIEYDGVIAQDRRPGGMACDDLSVYTASYSAGSVRDGTSFIRRAVVPLTVPAAAPTESLRVECIGAPVPGAEIWQATASVNGDLGTFVTGDTFSGGDYALTIPVELQPGTEPEGDHSAFLQLKERGPGQSIPTLCEHNFRLGAEAQSRTYTYEWRPHPGALCDCTSVTVRGGPNDDLLGIDEETTPVAAIPAAILSRVQVINDWRKASLGVNVMFDVGEALLISAEGQSFLHPISADVYNGFVQGFTENASCQYIVHDMDIKAIRKIMAMFEAALYDINTQAEGFESSVGTAFDDEFSFMTDKMAPLNDALTAGAAAWTSQVNTAFLAAVSEGSSYGNGQFSFGYDAAVHVARALAESKNKIFDLQPLISMAESVLINVYIAAGLQHPFDLAGGQGNDVWQDQNQPFWFVSEDGLLPIQPGFYYHSARMALTDDGEEEPVSTREFGIGVAIGCLELLEVGDKLIITTSPFANGRATYQQGDSIEWQIVRADPVQLGGGQAGDDTITFGVRGSVVGALDDYSLVTTALMSYSDGGLGFAIVPGAIEFAPGDRWTFSAEGGEFRWRRDGGSWTTTDIAGTVSLTAGVSAAFSTGATPSFVVGDTYQLRALAINGAGRVRRPDDESMTWTGSTQIDITPVSGAVDTLMIGGHTIPSTATITLSGSNDNWSTTAYSSAVTWRANNIGLLLASTTCAKWRLTVNTSGSIDWLYLGVPKRPLLAGTDLPEHGVWQRRVRLANGVRTRGIGGQIAHSECSEDSIDSLLTAIEYAHANDDGRIGAVSPEGEAGICTVPADIDIDDVFGYQPASAKRSLAITMQLTPI